MSLICEIRTRGPSSLQHAANSGRLAPRSVCVKHTGRGSTRISLRSGNDANAGEVGLRRPASQPAFCLQRRIFTGFVSSANGEAAMTLLLYLRYLPDNWTWVLVRSDDWPTILEGLNLHSGSPAFSVLAKRQTFLNEVLIDGTVQDRAELLRTFRVPIDQMLDIAVSHELAHAFCMEASEREADRFAEQLRKAGVSQCNGARNRTAPDTMRTLAPPR